MSTKVDPSLRNFHWPFGLPDGKPKNTLAMKVIVFASLVALAVAHTPVRAGQLPPSPFTTTLSNHTPLVFGMSVEDATDALGSR
jgi:hypothetical protein